MVCRKGATALFVGCLILFAALPLLAQQDTQPPVLTALSFTPTQVDTTSTSASVSVTAQLTDDLSGVTYGYLVFYSPSGQHSVGAYLNLTSGTNLNGTYTGTAVFPAYTEPGTWTALVTAYDNAGNELYDSTAQLQSLGFPATIGVTSQQDTQPPVLTALSFTPTQVDTTSTSASVSVTAQLTDDLSGVTYGYLVFYSPSGQHSVGAYLNLTSGTNLNGTYTGTAVFPAYTEPGTWTALVTAYDNAGNELYDSTAQLQSLGF